MSKVNQDAQDHEAVGGRVQVRTQLYNYILHRPPLLPFQSPVILMMMAMMVMTEDLGEYLIVRRIVIRIESRYFRFR